MFLKWFQFKFSKVFAIAGICLVHQGVASDARLPAALASLEKNYSKSKTLSARFVQVKKSVVLGTTSNSEGSLEIAFPNKFRWEFEKPDQNTSVTDGKTLWNYTPPFEKGERGQVIVKKMSEVRTDLLEAVLSGRFSSMKSVKIVEKGNSSFDLIPNKDTGHGIENIRLTLLDNKISQIKMIYKGGNESEFNLSEVRLGAKIDPKKFYFKIPPDTDLLN